MRFRFRLLITTAFVFCSSVANAELPEVEYYLNCKSADFNLTFKINTFFKTVTNVNFSKELKVVYWADEKIRAKFPSTFYLSKIVQPYQLSNKSQQVHVRFDRLSGSAELIGFFPPLTPDELIDAPLWQRGSSLVTDNFYADCKKIKLKF